MWKPEWTPKIIWRYMLRILPGQLLIWTIALGLWLLGLPWWIEAGLLLGWVAKDVALFPFMWWLVDDNHLPEHAMINREGVVIEPLLPDGTVRIQGELWQAQCPPEATPLAVGERVQVVKVQGLTVIVRAKRSHV